MADLDIALRLLERKHLRVLSTVSVVRHEQFSLGHLAHHGNCDHANVRGLTVCLRPEPPIQQDERDEDHTLVHELVHAAQVERGCEGRSGAWMERWLAPFYDDPETYMRHWRRYWQRHPTERQALIVASRLTGTPEQIEMALHGGPTWQ